MKNGAKPRFGYLFTHDWRFIRIKGKLSMIWLQVVIFVTASLVIYYSYYHHDNLHFHLLRTYAWAGYDEAQQLVGQRYAMGKSPADTWVSLLSHLLPSPPGTYRKY